MKAARNIIVKACLTADEFVQLAAECEAEDISHSKKLRDSWLSCRNGKPANRASGSTAAGQRMAKFVPGRMSRPAIRMRS